jgi:tetratricopeptide (TPR) repeat protein
VTSGCLLFTCRALARIGSAYHKQENLEMAIKYYNKSLAEHRNQELVKKKVEVRMRVKCLLFGKINQLNVSQPQAEKKLKELQKLQYLDSDKSLEEKEKGNGFFKKGPVHLGVLGGAQPRDHALYGIVRLACIDWYLRSGVSAVP